MPSWRLDGADPGDHRSPEQIRDAARVARDSANAAYEGMLQREREREEREAAEAEARRQARRDVLRGQLPDGGCLLTLLTWPLSLLWRL